MNTQTTFYIYIGGEGQNASFTSNKPSQSCNGGGAGGNGHHSEIHNGASGGGATDIRVGTDLGSLKTNVYCINLK